MKTANKVILKRRQTLKKRKTVSFLKRHWLYVAQLIVLFLIGVVIGRVAVITFLTIGL